MTRTNQTKTTTPTLIADCTCKPKAAPSGKAWQKVGKASKAKAPTQAPEPLFKRYEFKDLPGVALIVPDLTAPCDLIHIASSVAEQISHMTLNGMVRTLLAMHDVDMVAMNRKIAKLTKEAQQR